jgi:hypothetical protein
MNQSNMFATGEDTPLFSGCPVSVSLAKLVYNPQTSVVNAPLFGRCPICFGTGLVQIRKGQTRHCICRGREIR